MSANPDSPKKLYEIIIDSILKKIDQNQFSFETPICTEIQLMEEFQVSRITAKRAITELEYQGILYRKRGVGSFVVRDIFQKRAKMSNPASNTPAVFAFLLPYTFKQNNIFNMIAKINAKFNSSNCFLSLFITDGNRSKERMILKQLLEQNIAGILLYPASTDLHLDLLNQFVFRNIPVIISDQPVTTPYLYNILCDNVMGARKLAEHLISLGHRKICFFSEKSIASVPSVAERLGGYLEALRCAGLSAESEYIISRVTDTSAESLQEYIHTLKSSGVTAIICENDGVASRLIKVCGSLSLKVPKDISICGFCNDYDHITSICQNEELMAEHIGDIFLESLTPDRNLPHKILVPATLCVKASTGPCPD
ncbi:MAG: GntR family transcriptional regulator [Lachnospiraceae bacterium]|nr:GntR family transcriptional regulator [uncultured Acetatifactor sp.]MCI8544170.1 GntR family transcriptional regulator [Lachnospiraceae bacterium]